MKEPTSPAVGPAVPRVTAVELGIARILVVGTRLAITVMAVGVVLLFASGRPPLDSSWPRLDLAHLPADLLALRPEAFLWSGLLVVLATPLVRVGASTIGFALTHEGRMVALGAAVLVILALAVLSGLAASG